MVLVVKAVISLVSEPVPDPLFVFDAEIVGELVVLQHIPLTVIGEPPSDEIVPPLEALVTKILLTAVVVLTTGSEMDVVNVISFPYPVPSELVA